MFWGLVLEPGKKYTQKVEQPFHISQAVLDLKTADLEPVQFVLEIGGCSFILATLSKKHNIFQVPLDLNFETGDQISFRLIGKGKIHVTGYHVIDDGLEQLLDNEESDVDEDETLNETSTPGKRKKALTKSNEKKKKKLETTNEDEDEDEDEDEESDSDEESVEYGDTTIGESTLFDDEDEEDEEDSDDMEEGSDEEDEEEDDDDDDVEDESEEEEAPKLVTPKSDKKKKENQTLNASVNGISSSKKDKKNKLKLDGESPKNETPKRDGSSPKKEGKTPKQEGSQKKTPKSEKQAKQEKTPKTPSSPGEKKVLEGGVIIEELKVGEGQVVKPGKMAQVYYTGRLKSNNKQFDSATAGPGFKFRLGKGEVIRGWDIGVNGMKVGGKRRITIPSALAYGAKGSPPAIPPNSTLVFEVELKGVH